MNGETMERGNKEISIATLFAIFKKSFIWIVVAAVIAGILGGVYTLVFKRTEYAATVEFNVVNALSNNEYTSDSMLSAASRIADTCIEVAHKNVLHRAIVETNNIDALLNCSKDEAIRRVSELITATKATETSQIFSVSVTSDDKTLTYVLI